MTSLPRGEPPHIAALDGNELRRGLLSQLQQPYLKRALILAYRYNDFDLQSGARGSMAQTGLIRLLEKAALNRVDLTVVTRDPLDDHEFPSDFGIWYAGLRRLTRAGATVRLHPRLHAKVYLLESEGDRFFFAVGSSNLTYQGMGQRWAECNVRGFHANEFDLVLRHAARLSYESGARDFGNWETALRRSPNGQRALRLAGQ
jgi:PLD-like domain